MFILQQMVGAMIRSAGDTWAQCFIYETHPSVYLWEFFFNACLCSVLFNISITLWIVQSSTHTPSLTITLISTWAFSWRWCEGCVVFQSDTLFQCKQRTPSFLIKPFRSWEKVEQQSQCIKLSQVWIWVVQFLMCMISLYCVSSLCWNNLPTQFLSIWQLRSVSKKKKKVRVALIHDYVLTHECLWRIFQLTRVEVKKAVACMTKIISCTNLLSRKLAEWLKGKLKSAAGLCISLCMLTVERLASSWFGVLPTHCLYHLTTWCYTATCLRLRAKWRSFCCVITWQVSTDAPLILEAVSVLLIKPNERVIWLQSSWSSFEGAVWLSLSELVDRTCGCIL